MVENANNSSVLGIDGVPHFFLVNGAEDDREVLEKCETLIKHFCGSKTDLKWVTPDDCLQLDPWAIAKTRVFVFPEFNGPAFDHLRGGRKALLLGPSALMKCLTENVAIPNLPPPWIYNMAMQNLCMSLSGLSPDEKARYTDLVSFMGGLCLPVVPETATHLVSNTVQSVKYEVAVQLKIPIMQTDWIDEVWRRNQTEFISATDDQFSSYRLQTFFNLNVCCTLLSNDEKMLVERLVNENGGTFHRTLRPASIDILVLNDNGKNSDKFKAAMKHNKPCVTPRWILDSVEAEYALPYNKYRVLAEVRVSTPNKDDARNPEFSVSHIQGSGNTTVNDSLVSVRSKNLSMMSNIPEGIPIAATTTTSNDNGKQPDNDYYKDAMRNLTISNARKAGPFLDGCNIYFSGFSVQEVTKLNKIASLCGATRFEEIDENVTHVIVGKRDEKELKLFQDMNKGIHFVKFDWLKDSMESKIQANEDEYCYELAAVTNKTVLLEQPSPASKRNIAAMNSSFKKPFPRNDQMAELSMAAGPSAAVDADGVTSDVDAFPLSKNNLMNRYLHSSAANMELVERTGPQKENTVKERASRRYQDRERSRLMHTTFDSDLASEEFEVLNFFNGKLFATQHTSNGHEHAQMLIDIRNFGGTVVDESFKGVVDFLVTSHTKLMNFQPLYKAKEIVSNLWMEDVIGVRSEVPIQYYHRVISVTDDTVLEGITCTISTYSGPERTFLTAVCLALGACVEDKYEKKKFPVLICPKAEGSKYKGALNWEFPVVSNEWLLDCFNKCCLYKLGDYLVGDSKLSSKYQHFLVLNQRGIPKGTEPPTPSHNDSSIIRIQSESPLLTQVPPSPAVVLKRKSDDGDTIFGRSNAGKKFKAQEDLTLWPPQPEGSRSSPSVKNRRVNALRSESKSSASPTTPTSQHVREMGHEFGYDTPRRKQLYDVLKETNNLTPSTPHTPASMKMPPLQLHPDPEATPSRQWDVLHKFSGFLGKGEKGGQAKSKKKKESPSTPLSEIKRRFYQNALGKDFVFNANNSTLLNINTQPLEVVPKSTAPEGADNTTVDNVDCSADVASTSQDTNANALKGLMDMINKRKSEPKLAVEILETCPVVCPDSENRDEIMVGWVGAEQKVPYENNSARRESKSMEPNHFFLTSGTANTALNSIMQMISDLKGEISNKPEYDARCTHLICDQMGRREKVLCALAAGKWIVNLQYIEDSFKEKRFLKEEEYEWGNPVSKFDLEKFSAIDQSVAKAAYSWRMRIVDPKSDKFRGGAFHGFIVIIWATKDGFKNIVEAGGGKVLDIDKSYEKSGELAKTATHCFCEKRTAFPRENLRFCNENSITVYDIQFLNEYLLNPNSANLQSFVIKGKGGKKSGSVG